jgi:hypothetical protein
LVNKAELLDLKKMVKKTKDKLVAKKIEREDLDQTKFRIKKLERDVKKIQEEERLEREIRIAEVEASKAENMMKYKEEIYSKPKREWIVSDKMKEQIRVESHPDYVPKKAPRAAPSGDAEGGSFGFQKPGKLGKRQPERDGEEPERSFRGRGGRGSGRGRGGSSRGGERSSDRERGGFDRERSSDRGRGGFSRGRSSERGRGGFDRERSSERGRGNLSRGRGGSDRGGGDRDGPKKARWTNHSRDRGDKGEGRGGSRWR